MLRVGVQFEKPATAVQASLDRFVFGLLRRKAEARRLTEAQPGTERRIAPRVEVGDADGLVIALLPMTPRGVLAPAKPEAAPSCTLTDLSTTGCAFLCADLTVKTGARLRLRLKGREIDVELGAKVVHVSIP